MDSPTVDIATTPYTDPATTITSPDTQSQTTDGDTDLSSPSLTSEGLKTETAQKDGCKAKDCDNDEEASSFDANERQLATQYLRDHVLIFCELEELRQKGWNNPEGDEYFKKQRFHTDNATHDTSAHFLRMMQQAADKLHRATGIFTLSPISGPGPGPGPRDRHRRVVAPTVLGFGFAPGGFLQKVLRENFNRDSHAVPIKVWGITLPDSVSGIPVLIHDPRLHVIHADITMLAADLGMLPDEIPPSHPDALAGNFLLRRQLPPLQRFDLVTCEAGVLRPHHAVHAGAHREHGEHIRLRAAQLALALARVKPGGRMVLLMHKAESCDSLRLFWLFGRFSKVRLYKPDGPHHFKSSFYMVATDVQSQSEEAQRAVKGWVREWKMATFGSLEECLAEMKKETVGVEKLLEEFGEEWVRLGSEVWETQLEGLKTKSFTKDAAIENGQEATPERGQEDGEQQEKESLSASFRVA